MHHEVQQEELPNVDSSLPSLDDLACGDSLDKSPISESSVDCHSVHEAVIVEDEQKSVVGKGSGWGEHHGQSGDQRRTQKLGFCQENHHKQGRQNSVERNSRFRSSSCCTS
ncbi:hypothetical protein ACOSQ3_023671 [Xanthoceras sorbifolium]